MEEDFEELDDLLNAAPAVVFTKDVDPGTNVALEILAYLDIETELVNLTGLANLERMVMANSNGFALPLVFIEGAVFSDAATLLTFASTGELAQFLDMTGVRYNKARAAEIAAANQ